MEQKYQQDRYTLNEEYLADKQADQTCKQYSAHSEQQHGVVQQTSSFLCVRLSLVKFRLPVKLFVTFGSKGN
jgi:hypothetical protein